MGHFANIRFALTEAPLGQRLKFMNYSNSIWHSLANPAKVNFNSIILNIEQVSCVLKVDKSLDN